ncbi:MAG TPA: tRNA (guanosine(37)-N1)-methyltransferase TrmD [Candidatus Krumholzibacteria bacterium]|nr:tRNA (guanosine(37)-N1)-methyltransferase TrmD [Candidatus Krumholzibacteria bacterium]HPD71387.1 tRNA (guanosine(37)-N1)-methyltransferase TrmD [Candidatus Krumholzibacteria bacterium]HRY38913.1 tRNA (guanosine(37)-N1)-methyltransferase TrmD [Candidatus Krumholzibacteria bacterium]
MLEFKVLTLFPEMVRAVLATSILGRAERQGQVRYTVTDIRDFAVDKHGTVDDTPYGGGAGMVLMAPCVVEAVEAVRGRADAPVLLTSPQGERLDEALTLELLGAAEAAGEIVVVCGHYKGVDERVRELIAPREVSIGDYVLSGGELPALVIVDAMVRRIAGVLHDGASAASDSFTVERGGGLDCPWYTKPPVYRDLEVPEVLMTGHHARIEQWRREQAQARTRERRPDLLPGSGGDAQPRR